MLRTFQMPLVLDNVRPINAYDSDAEMDLIYAKW